VVVVVFVGLVEQLRLGVWFVDDVLEVFVL